MNDKLKVKEVVMSSDDWDSNVELLDKLKKKLREKEMELNGYETLLNRLKEVGITFNSPLSDFLNFDKKIFVANKNPASNIIEIFCE